jgi:hypothetical protein
MLSNRTGISIAKSDPDIAAMVVIELDGLGGGRRRATGRVGAGGPDAGAC